MAAPEGSLLQADRGALLGSPFDDWSISGLLLTTLVGGGYALAAAATALPLDAIPRRRSRRRAHDVRIRGGVDRPTAAGRNPRRRRCVRADHRDLRPAPKEVAVTNTLRLVSGAGLVVRIIIAAAVIAALACRDLDR